MYENEGGAPPKENPSPRLPRVILKPTSQSGQQDQQDHLGTNQADRGALGKPGTPPLTTEFLKYFFLTVEPQDTTREKKVKRLIEKFENHKHKESFVQD